MKEEIVELRENLESSPLYSEDLAPVPKSKRTWKMRHLAAIWVGMAVCIPTYLLASYMIVQGIAWWEALIIIGLANLIITVPMVLNGHAGVKYGIPFPVLGRAAFGIHGIHLASIIRGLVACGWFGIQTWIGGLAFYAIFNAVTGNTDPGGLTFGHFAGFALFWLINIYFIWKGTESIKWLEQYSAPILIAIGIILIIWGANQAGGVGIVLEQSSQMENPVAEIVLDEENNPVLTINAITDKNGNAKAEEYQLSINDKISTWQPLVSRPIILYGYTQNDNIRVQLRKADGPGFILSGIADVSWVQESKPNSWDRIFKYLFWLTAMVGFWATMSLSIADITRYASTQKEQITGQFLGLPGTMMLFSFVGIFVTCAALINFDSILIASDAPWDPVNLIANFENPIVVVIAQVFLIIATLSTNIAANVIAPANAFSNIFPKKISFRTGGLITGIIGIIICPWWLLAEISHYLILVSGLLGPVLAILLCDYFLLRKKKLLLDELFKENGVYAYSKSKINFRAYVALAAGVLTALAGKWVPELAFLYDMSWFSGFIVSFILYYMLMKNYVKRQLEPTIAEN